MSDLFVRSGGAWVPASVAGDGSFELRDVDGGVNYYSQFTNSMPTDPAYFPVAQWGVYDLNDTTVALDMSRGINLNIFTDDVTETAMTAMYDADLLHWHALGYDDTYVMDNTKCIVVIDEADMSLRSGYDTWNGTTAFWPTNCTGPAGQNQDGKIPPNDGIEDPVTHPGARCAYTACDTQSALVPPGRMQYFNWGKEVLNQGATPDADCAHFVNTWGDVTNADFYWMTDPHVFNVDGTVGLTAPSYFPEAGNLLTFNQLRRPSNYGYMIDRMRDLDGRDGAEFYQRKPIYITVELGNPWGDGEGSPHANAHRSITPAEIKSCVWHGIIAGARGVLYFGFNFSSTPVVQHHILRDSTNFGATITGVTALNAQIAGLAEILNSPFVTNRFIDGSNVRSMVKMYNDKLYVFSASTKDRGASSYSATFQIEDIGSSTANVLGESRTVSVTSGSWTDTFANENAVHVYEITP